jgi:alkylation response protein AidB-like acyl-CoA dehydrogenase
MPVAVAADPVERVRDVAHVLRRDAEEGEAARALTPAAQEALVAAGVFDLLRPRSLGGEEGDLLTFVRAIREASKADGSAGWCAMISGVYATFAGLLPRAGAEEVFASKPTIIAGALAPLGQAIQVSGGFRVSGQWPFGSNAPHAEWFCAGAVIIRDGAPIMRPNGLPTFVLGLMPRSEVTVIDTWHTTGLRATGSHDYAVQDVFVPAERTFWFSDPPTEPGPLYSLPMIASYGSAIGAVPVGVAEHLLEAYAEFAPAKKPGFSPVTLDMKESVQDRLGVAIANVDAANAYLEHTVTDCWDVVSSGRRLDWVQRGKLWLAGTHAGALAKQAADELYTIGGASSVFAKNAFDRCQRDIRTSIQHVMTQYGNYELAGKQTLGLDVSMSIWGIDDRGDG